MILWLSVALFAACFSGIAWYFVSGVKIKAGWQNGESPLAKWLDQRRRIYQQSTPSVVQSLWGDNSHR